MQNRGMYPALILISLFLAACCPGAPAQVDPGSAFVRGDANADGEMDIADPVLILICHFLGSGCSSCADASDADDNGAIEVADPILLLNFLFLRGPDPAPPRDACGDDETADNLACAAFPPCEDPDAIPTARGNLIVKPIEHATLALLWDGKTIYIDPVGGAARFSSLPAPDLVLVTDIHGDHMDSGTLRAVVRASTILVVPQAVVPSLAGVGGERKVLANGESATVLDIPIEAVPMYNLTPDRLRYHEKGRGNGYVLDLAGTRVYISGDTEDIVEMRNLTGIDLAFICMNLPFTMTPQQAASAALEFKPGIVYPYHYRGQNPGVFQSLVEAGQAGIDVRLREWYP